MELWKILFVVFVAELPCMIRTTGLQIYSGQVWKVITGTLLGNLAALVVGLCLAQILVKQFSIKDFAFVDYITGGVFILLGLYIICYGEH